MHNNTQQPLPAPSIKRRLISMMYEAFLVLAVEMLATLVYLLVTGNRQGPAYRYGLMSFLFLVAAAYFVHFWRDSGHTLAMKTWRIKLVQPGHARVSFKKAALRYVLSWGWFLPALAVCWFLGWNGKAEVSAALVVGLVAWAMTALLDKDRQFLHDKLAGTRLVQLPKTPKQ